MAASKLFVCAVVPKSDAVYHQESSLVPGGVVIASVYEDVDGAMQSIGIVLRRGQAIKFAEGILARCVSESDQKAADEVNCKLASTPTQGANLCSESEPIPGGAVEFAAANPLR